MNIHRQTRILLSFSSFFSFFPENEQRDNNRAVKRILWALKSVNKPGRASQQKAYSLTAQRRRRRFKGENNHMLLLLKETIYIFLSFMQSANFSSRQIDRDKMPGFCSNLSSFVTTDNDMRASEH